MSSGILLCLGIGVLCVSDPFLSNMPRSPKDTMLSGPYGGPCSLKSARDRAPQVEVFALQSKNYEASRVGKVAPYCFPWRLSVMGH